MGCSTCSKCKWIRNSAFCGTTKLTEKQLYAKNGFCSTYEPKKEAFEQTDKIGGVISANDEKHYWEHSDADYDNMIPNSQYKFYPQCYDRKQLKIENKWFNIKEFFNQRGKYKE